MSDIAKVLQNVSVGLLPDSDYSMTATARAVCGQDCPVCHGLGYVRSNARYGEPGWGKILPCPNSDPFDRYGHLLGIEGDDRSLTWSNVIDKDNVSRAVRAVQDTIQRGYGWVFLWGDYGLAKTLLLKIALAEYVRITRKPAGYVRMAEILDHLRGAFDANDPSTESQNRLDAWSSLPLLCIDEFDRVRNTEYATERRFILMDRRYEQACRQKSITLMASNADPESLEGYLTDRIRDGRFSIVHIKGQSARPMMTY